jgi:PAS domain S-box-containing protein
MPPLNPAPVETPAPWLDTVLHVGGVQRSAERRIRLALYATFGALALAVALLGWFVLDLERLRAVDAELVERAAQQRARAQEIGRVALTLTQAGATPLTQEHDAQRLDDLLRLSAQRSLELDELLQRQMAHNPEVARRLNGVLEGWHQARERLGERGQALLGQVDNRDEDELRQRANALQAEVSPTAEAARLLAEELRNAAGERGQRLRTLLGGGMLALLGTLVLMALLLVEPTARAVGLQVRRQAQLATELQRLALVAEHTNNSVLVTDAEDRIEWANQAFTRFTGWTLAEVKGRRPTEFAHAASADPAVITRLKTALAEGRGLREEWANVTRDGREIWFDVDLRPVHDANGRLHGFISVASDITERRQLQQQLKRHASTDTLTRLPNRAAVMERLQAALAHAARHPGYGFAVLFMDFDRFKQVNDSLGHAAGDELLRQVARRLQRALRPGDALARLEGQADPAALPGAHDVAARLGGDEFVVVLEGLHDADAVGAVAQRVLQELSEPYTIGHAPVQSSASIGVVRVQAGEAGAPMPSAEDVLRNADIAMYEAKRAGRGRWVLFDDSMHERAVRQMAMETELRRALQQGELFVVYQPVLDLAPRGLAGVEALVRWRHPVRGLVPPAEFIALAEECGLIDEVGALVLDKACTQFVQWRTRLGALAPAMLAVNFSRAQLQRPGVADELQQVLQRCGLEPARLQVEVTESLAAQDERVQATLRSIKALGVRLALDDFGTGYSSLACLHQLPVDTVKVDRSFVQHAQTVEYHRVLIEATIRVARTLGMTTVAEGIETEDQAALMHELACDRGQGYLFSRPLEAAALEAWALQREALPA